MGCLPLNIVLQKFILTSVRFYAPGWLAYFFLPPPTGFMAVLIIDLILTLFNNTRNAAVCQLQKKSLSGKFNRDDNTLRGGFHRIFVRVANRWRRAEAKCQ